MALIKNIESISNELFDTNLNKVNSYYKMLFEAYQQGINVSQFIQSYLSNFLVSIDRNNSEGTYNLNSLSDEQLSKLITSVIDIYIMGLSVEMKKSMSKDFDESIYTDLYINIYSDTIDYINEFLSLYNREFKGKMDYQNIVNSYFDNLPIEYKKDMIDNNFSERYNSIRNNIDTKINNYYQQEFNSDFAQQFK